MMNNINEYYDTVTEVSSSTREALDNLKLAQTAIRQALYAIKSIERHGSVTISPISTVTTGDVYRNLLFLELLLNQTFGVSSTLIFQELIGLTSYLTDQEEL